jgi:MYXO-CTERM domain-containing protein
MGRLLRSTSWLAISIALAGCGSSAPPEAVGSSRQAANVCASGSTVEGIDVSHWDGTVDWTQVKGDGRVFGIAKATQGTYYEDDQFAANWAAMKGAGVIRGAYHFLDYINDPVQQADYFVNMLNQSGGLEPGDLPPVLDVEDVPESGGGYETIDLSVVLPWLERVECLTGKKPIIYSSARIMDPENPPAALAGYPLWVANYTSGCPDLPALWSSWSFWQYSSTGSVAGLADAVDVDRFNGSLSALQAFAHLQSPTCDDAGSDAAPESGGAAGSGGQAGSGGFDGGVDSGAAGAAGTSSDAGAGAGGATGDAGVSHASAANQSGGCGCRAAGDGDSRSDAWLLLFALLLACDVRRRKRAAFTRSVRLPRRASPDCSRTPRRT